MSALNNQVGGSHYKDCTIQPIEYIQGNRLGFIEGNIVKYITHWREKGGIQDLEKIRHYVDLLIELETKNDKQPDLPGLGSTITQGDVRFYLPREAEPVDIQQLTKDVYPSHKYIGVVIADTGYHRGFYSVDECIGLINRTKQYGLTILSTDEHSLIESLRDIAGDDKVYLLNWGHNGYRALRYERGGKNGKVCNSKN